LNERNQTFTNLNYGTNSKNIYNTPNLPSSNLNTNIFKNNNGNINSIHESKKINYQNPYYLSHDQTTKDTTLMNPEITPISNDNRVHFNNLDNREKVSNEKNIN
jgi:hypothetical protein